MISHVNKNFLNSMDNFFHIYNKDTYVHTQPTGPARVDGQRQSVEYRQPFFVGSPALTK